MHEEDGRMRCHERVMTQSDLNLNVRIPVFSTL